MAIELSEIHLIGLALRHKTTNENGQSNIDCGNLWQKFETEKISHKIPGKLSEEIFAVYYQYEGDFTQPFSYFIGCRVNNGTEVPQEMDSLNIPAGSYHKFLAKGKKPECIADTWREIWKSEIHRQYLTDFEVYDQRSNDWNNTEVDIYVSVKQ